jgi:hypothetical protein
MKYIHFNFIMVLTEFFLSLSLGLWLTYNLRIIIVYYFLCLFFSAVSVTGYWSVDAAH